VKNYDRVLVVAYVVIWGGCPHDKYLDVVGKPLQSVKIFE
jgi:hypothetical protein